MQDQKYTVESRRFPGWMWMDVCEDSLLQERKPSELRRGNPAPLSTIHPPIRLSQSIRQILIADREKKKKKKLVLLVLLLLSCPLAQTPPSLSAKDHHPSSFGGLKSLPLFYLLLTTQCRI